VDASLQKRSKSSEPKGKIQLVFAIADALDQIASFLAAGPKTELAQTDRQFLLQLILDRS